ncbi:MAG TPA: transporter substrate-binding domain-containing protein [Micropepsaceae bacterium]|nr:transporter substrate-binding domain-containing protein [Micropepsaceae bacterium]
MLLSSPPANAGARLDAIKARGSLNCGVGASVPGFSRRDAQGIYRGFDADICRAVATAIFGSSKVTFKPIDTLANFLKTDDIDLVLRGLTWTFGREMRSELRFGPIILHDGQSFLVTKKSGIGNVAALSGKTVCVSTDAEFLSTLRYYFRVHNLVLKAVVKDKRPDSEDGFFKGECDAMAADSSELAEAVIGKAKNADDYVILPEQLTKEPLAPLLRKGDDQFLDVVRWAMFTLVDAEELGLSSVNADAMRSSDNPEVKAFFAAAPPNAGVTTNWTYDIVKNVGNYGEVFDRNLGVAHLPRALNRSWKSGGLMYAPPVR